jgi:malonyl-CoA/methylmalonyl-CoA synthetase
MRINKSSILEMLVEHKGTSPAKLCIRFDNTSWSYNQLHQNVATFATALHNDGLTKGDRVALFLENSPTFLAGYLGTHLAGGVVVLVNTAYKQTELRHILNDAGVRLCLTDATRAPELEKIRAELPALEKIIIAGDDYERFADVNPRSDFSLPDGNDLAIIAYTSGTTGRSKGAMLLHRNLAANALAVCEAWRWTENDHLLLTLPLFHAHGLMVGVHGTLARGASLELHRQFDAPTVYERLLSGEFSMFFGVPTMYTRLLAEAARHKERPRPLRLYVAGSAPLSPQTFNEFKQVFGQTILERYGMTETIMNLTNPYDGERRAGTVGQPFPGQEARIVDIQTREVLSPDVTGEIEVRGPHVFAGYWQQPEATAAAFDPDGWFRTGDLGFVTADGYFTINGRAKELIITGGYNVYPREVEEVIESCPGVAEVAVVGRPDPDFGESVVAVVVSSDPNLSAETVIEFCRDRLASYKKPRRVIFAASLPRNALGKIQKHLITGDGD